MNICFRQCIYKSMSIYSQMSVFSKKKMCVLITILLLVTCDLSTSTEIYNRENNRLQIGFQNAKFFLEIQDWLFKLRNQIHERLFGLTTTSAPPLTIEILNLDKFELQNAIKTHGWHLLNLSILSFDPNQDWGFRIGDWYFIQKGFNQNGYEDSSDELNFQTPSTIKPKDTTKIETEQTFDFTNDPEVTESSQTISSITTPVTQQIDPQTTIRNTEQIDSSESSSLTMKGLEESETDSDFVHKGSVEVLMG
ncbi:uncharacterized protein [Bombus flavifrons]|uniref:uncharacterized protein isoform X1 n=1 Tax=Bombus flavifrons TaxID=103934 RepID=UPI003703C41A